MRVVANAGLNLPDASVARYEVHLTPQRIVVDGVQHDTRRATYRDIDHWYATAKQTPHILGTSAAELVQDYEQLARDASEILVLTASRKLIGTYDAAMSAKRVFDAMPRKRPVRIEVIDLANLDIGTTMLALACLEGVRHNEPLGDIVRAMGRAIEANAAFFFPADLERFAKGGRAGESKALLASARGVTPLIRVVDGEPKPVGRIVHGDDPVPAFADKIVEAVGPGRSVWVGLTHAGDTRHVDALRRRLEKLLDVRYVLTREESATLYLNIGQKSFGVAVLPVDSVPWSLDGQLASR